jgi:hypothetical protein
LKKRSKKLLQISRAGWTGAALNDQKFFGSFFQKRTYFVAIVWPQGWTLASPL